MKNRSSLWAIFPCLLIAVACGIRLWAIYGIWSLACYAAMILALPFSSLMHELGHILIGAICKIKAIPEFKLFSSSSVKLIPETDKNLRLRLLFTASGGLVVNLLFVIAGLVGCLVRDCAFLCIFMPSSVYLVYLNGILSDLQSGKTDGQIINGLIKNDDTSKVMLAVITAQAQILKGKPVAELDENLLFNLPVIREDDPAFISLTELRYEYYKAKGNEEMSEKYRQRLQDLQQYL